MTAAENGADYVAFGAFYKSGTKTPKYQADPAILSWWQEMMETPCVAIGGITPKASAVSMTMFFGWPPLPVALAFGMKCSG